MACGSIGTAGAVGSILSAGMMRREDEGQQRKEQEADAIAYGEGAVELPGLGREGEAAVAVLGVAPDHAQERDVDDGREPAEKQHIGEIEKCDADAVSQAPSP